MSGTFTPPIITNTITSANAVYMLAIANLYPAAQQIQGFADDSAFETEDAEVAETKLGVDGGFTAGWVPVAFEETIELLASSPSCSIFDNWHETQRMTGSIYYATATIYVPGTGRKLTRSQGVLYRYAPIAPAKKVMENRSFHIRWGQTTGWTL